MTCMRKSQAVLFVATLWALSPTVAHAQAAPDPGDTARGVLREILADRDVASGAREEAARILATVGDRAAVPDLLDALADTGFPGSLASMFSGPEEYAWGQWQAAARALGSLGGGVQVTDALKGALRRHPYKGVRAEAAVSLARLGEPAGERWLRKHVGSWDAAVRDVTVRALAEAPPFGALQMDLLRKAAMGPWKTSVGLQAAEGLHRLGDRATAGRAVAAALKGIQDPVALQAAFETAGRLGLPDAVPVILRRLPGIDDFWPAEAAGVEALGRLGDPAAVPVLEKMLASNPERWVRQAAAEALGRIGDTSARKALEEAKTRDPEPGVRLRAEVAIARLGGPDVLATLRDRLDEGRNEYRHALYAVEAMGEMGDRRAVGDLVAKTREQGSSLRAAAAVALARIGDPAAVPAVAALLRSKLSTDREAAARALGHLADPVALAALGQALKDTGSPTEFLPDTNSMPRTLAAAAMLEIVARQTAVSAVGATAPAAPITSPGIIGSLVPLTP